MRRSEWKKIVIFIITMCLYTGLGSPCAEMKAEVVPYWEADDDWNDFWKVYDEFVYCEMKNGQVNIREILSKEPEITLPDTINGKPVALYDGRIPKTVQKIHLPKTLKRFEPQCDYFTNNIESITVDKENKYLSSKDGILYSKDKKTLVRFPNARKEVTIPKSVTKIANDAFAEAHIKKVVIPDTVKQMEASAFYYCQNLESVKLSKNIKKIEYNTFFGCESLKAVTIPKNVQEIGSDAFRCCFKLKKVTFEEGIRLKKLAGFCACISLESIQIPNGITVIEEDALAACQKLKNVTLPDTLEIIEQFAFRGCTALKSIEVPKNVKWIGPKTFEGCSGLKRITVKATGVKKSMRVLLITLGIKKGFLLLPKRTAMHIDMQSSRDLR